MKLFDSMLNWLYFEIYFQIKNFGYATVWPRYHRSVPDFNLMSVTADLRDGGLTNLAVSIYSRIEKSEFESIISYRETICIQSLSQFAVVKAHNT